MSGQEPSWDLYGALLAVLREGSLSGAARALGVAQPTVRRQIEALEAQLGAVLFTRAANGLVPTELALATRPYAESIAATARALQRAVSGGGEARGTVRVTASEIVATEVLPPVFAELRRARPELQIELAATNRTEDLLRRDADVAVRMVEPTQVGLVRRRAGRVELGLYAHARYLAGRKPPRTLAQLVSGEHGLVGADRSRALLDALQAAGVSATPRDFALRSDSDVVQLAAVRAGVGIGVCQVPLSRAPVPLVRVLPSVTFHLDVWVVMHEDLRGSPRVRAVFELLAERLQGYTSDAGLRRRRR